MDFSNFNVRLNSYGYYEIINKPSEQELNDYYEKKYFQEHKATHKKVYDKDEIYYIYTRLERKLNIIDEISPRHSFSSFLDVGCGEGWALDFFNKKGFDCTGIDYSSFGLKMQNPQFLKNTVIGNIYRIVADFAKAGKKYDIILLDNVLEHVMDPLVLLRSAHSLLTDNGILIIEVPNDFSKLQLHLIENGFIDRPFWIAYPDHLSYFNKDGLTNLAKDAGFLQAHLSSDYPIGLNLLNPLTNYVKNKHVGKTVHKSRMDTELFLDKLGKNQTTKLFNTLAEAGLGRNLICYFKKLAE